MIAAGQDGFWLVDQFRHPLGRRSWEFPQGTWGHDDDGAVRTGTPEYLARAELAEETGIGARTLRRLGHLDLAPGLMTQGFDVWPATGLTEGPTAREATEADMRSMFVLETELRSVIAGGGSPTDRRPPRSPCSCSTAADSTAIRPNA